MIFQSPWTSTNWKQSMEGFLWKDASFYTKGLQIRHTKYVLHSEFDGLAYGYLTGKKAQQALQNLKTPFGDEKEDSLTSLEICYLLF